MRTIVIVAAVAAGLLGCAGEVAEQPACDETFAECESGGGSMHCDRQMVDDGNPSTPIEYLETAPACWDYSDGRPTSAVCVVTEGAFAGEVIAEGLSPHCL